MSQKKRKSVQISQKPIKAESQARVHLAPELKSGFELIRFDKKVWVFLGICLAGFILFVALKWHNSSIGVWNIFVDDGGDINRGVIAGTPRPIRSDEWQVYASFIMSQYQNDFPVENPALGAGKTPLTFTLPTYHLISIVRPSFWGYYFLDIERAFSWQWNFKIFPFLIVCFLLLMLFTGNNFLLSMAGSIFLLLSSAIQWWSINTEIFTFGILCVISFIYLVFGEKRHHILIAGVVMPISAFSYAMVLYPAYQVPFAYALLALILGYTLAYRKRLASSWKINLSWRIVAAGVSFGGLAILLFLFYDQAKETIAIVTQTIYPGKRNETGGNFHFTKLFADNFSFFTNEEKYPVQWKNICELSSFLMLSLLPAILVVVESIKRKKADPLLLSAIAFQAFILTYILLGFPAFAARLTFLSMSPDFRSFYIFGFFNVIVTILFLARHRTTLIPATWIARFLSFTGIAVLTYLIHSVLNAQIENYFSITQVWIATFLFTSLTWLLLEFNRGKIFRILFFVLLGIALLPNLRINPLARGLSPFLENKIFKAVSEIEAKAPGARWIVYGKYSTPNFLKAAGVNCFNGVQFAPPLEDLHTLDTDRKYENVYNRFAHIGFTALIQPNDSISFELKQSDLYMIRMDPCSPRLTKLGIEYVMFTYEPHPFELDCMTPVASFPNHHIYKRGEL